jgi:preprotein translocase subunit SecG
LTYLITAIHLIVCLSLIMIVLLQRGKGADMGAAFGGSSQTVFGSRGAISFLGKMTTVVAVVFMITSLTLAYMSSNKKVKTIMDDVPAAQETPMNVTPPVEMPGAASTQDTTVNEPINAPDSPFNIEGKMEDASGPSAGEPTTPGN